MVKIQTGDRVRIKRKTDWPEPPGYRFGNAEGTVVKWLEYDEVLDGFEDFVYVHIEKAEGEGEPYLGNNMCFRTYDLEKIK